MGYVEINKASQGSSDFMRQIVVAMVTAAQDIRNEDPGTANHTERLAWAEKVGGAVGASRMAEKWRWRVLENATIRTSLATLPDPNPDALDVGPVSDSDIQFVVNSLIQVFAGY